MSRQNADVVICGAGIAGIATAYQLGIEHGLTNVVLIDERPPMSLTSDKSTECYRNWWPGPGDAMVSFMNRSIDLIEEMSRRSNDRFLLNRRGYLYATANPVRAEDFKRTAEETSALGAGPVRYHTGQPGEPAYKPAPAHGFENQPVGADLILDADLIKQHFPYLAENTVAVLHARRCGWFSGQQFGMYMLEQAQARGVELIEGRVEEVKWSKGRVEGVRVGTTSGEKLISTRHFVNAAGPFVDKVASLVDVELPVFSELHLKVNFNDHLNVIPREAPFVIWADPQKLTWSPEEAEMLAEMEETRWLVEELPEAAHFRPEGHGESTAVLMLWPYHDDPVESIVVPPPPDPDYPEVVLRGMCRLAPGLQVYLDRMPKPFVDGGYYTKTRENRLLACPLSVDGAYLIGALSGYGLMASPAAGELISAHITGSQLPAYAPAFDLKRYDDPAYQKLLENWGASGQL